MKKISKTNKFKSFALLCVFLLIFAGTHSYQVYCLWTNTSLNAVTKEYKNIETQSLYREWTSAGDTNKADFFAIQRLLVIFNDLGMMSVKNNEPIIVGGTNEGQLSESILNEYSQTLFYGFEIMPQTFEVVRERLRSFKRAEVVNAGMSDSNLSGVPIGGGGEGAGLYDPEGQRGWKLSSEQANTVRLANWTRERGIIKVKYLVIDTEGHEPKVIRGMDLHDFKNQKKFYLFQFELGGTWAENDKRHGKDPWSQRETAAHLEKYGYDLLLIGPEEWLYVRADFFQTSDNPALLDEGFGPFVQGNLLAMHRSTPLKLRERILANTKIL
jgi:FkbM family methyltransferase